MQVLDLRKCAPMKRDMDLIRDILIRIESDSQMDGTREFYFSTAEEMGFPDHSSEEVAYNFSLLVEEGFVDGAASAFLPIVVRRLTWGGHEFLDNIKDAGIWGKTKARIKDLPSVGLKVVAAIAEAELKKHFLLP
jgi:Hypothetical protein (DUF2513)